LVNLVSIETTTQESTGLALCERQKNKWKYDEYGNCEGKEKFFGSSTFLVWLTDLWHLCKFLMLMSICAGIVFYMPLFKWYFDLLIFYCLFTITFELFYKKILIKK